MPNSDIASPPVAAPVNRMALGVDSVRLGGWETVDPSTAHLGWMHCSMFCFEGIDE